MDGAFSVEETSEEIMSVGYFTFLNSRLHVICETTSYFKPSGSQPMQLRTLHHLIHARVHKGYSRSNPRWSHRLGKRPGEY